MNKKFLFALMFNIVETLVIFMIGLIFKLSPSLIIVLMITFFLTRMLCGQPKHYNKWYRCFVWSALTFTSVYALTNLDLLANILLTISIDLSPDTLIIEIAPTPRAVDIAAIVSFIMFFTSKNIIAQEKKRTNLFRH